MRIELSPGESLTVKTPRGTIVFEWIYDTEDLTVSTFYNPKDTESTIAMMDKDASLTQGYKYAAEIQLKASD